MKQPRYYRPKRRVRNEFFPLLIITALPTMLVLAIPREAIGFLPKAGLAADFRLVRIRDAERGGRGEGTRGGEVGVAREFAWCKGELRIEMFADSPPERKQTEMLAISSRTRPPEPEPPPFEPSAVPQTLAAPAPTKIPSEPESAATTFSREDLLRLD